MSHFLTVGQIGLIEESFIFVKPISDQAAMMFYDRLFELDPSLRPLFKGDMKEQGGKLMAMLDVAVSSLNKLDQLIPAIEALGERHKNYGVKDRHFDVVGAALIWTFATALGSNFTPEMKEAWETTYMTLATVMKRAMQSQAPIAVAVQELPAGAPE